MDQLKVTGGSIEKRTRKSGVPIWDVRFRVNGQSKRRSFVDQVSAAIYRDILLSHGLDEADRTIGAGDPMAHKRNAEKMTVADLAEAYAENRRGSIEPGTLATYEGYMRDWIGPHIGRLPIQVVTEEHIIELMRDMTGAGRSAKSVKNVIHYLGGMYKFAMRKGWATVSPTLDISVPKTVRAQPVFLSPSEWAQILGHLDPHYRPFFMLIAATGLRFNEAAALEGRHFDRSSLSVTVAQAWKYDKKTRTWYIGPPKSEMSRRTLFIPQEVMDLVTPLIRGQRELVFRGKRGGPVRNAGVHESYWGPAVRLANGLAPKTRMREVNGRMVERLIVGGNRVPSPVPINKFPRIHDLRHSHASWLIEQGLPLPVIQRRLGHESIKTTVDTYGHLSPEARQRAADATAVSLGPALAAMGTPFGGAGD